MRPKQPQTKHKSLERVERTQNSPEIETPERTDRHASSASAVFEYNLPGTP